ncbi:MAG: Transcriptional regulator, TrmB [Microgenomates group bacterium GW2011_GWA2_46_7]|nr:MAG: Transcriptional regulator, TrmB [Microgenomates group bacterium GW2011_GWA2_46_7]
MTPNEYLAKLGLSSRQIKVYLDLAAYPESTVVEINKRVLSPRSTIYLELERLINLGFVISKKIGKSTHYKITDPKILQLTLTNEATKLEFLTSHLQSFSQNIQALSISPTPPKTINIYKGPIGIKQLQIIFNQPKPLVWSDIPGFLTNNVEAKTLDETKIKFDRLTLIYHDVLTVCSLKTDSDQYGIEIRDQLLINSYKQIFTFLWDHVAKSLKQ